MSPARPDVPRPLRWGKRLDRWHDERGPLHLLTERNEPACGASYYTMTGAYPGAEKAHDSARCRRCLAVARRLE